MTKPLSIQELAALAAQTEDQSVEQETGSFDYAPPAEGVTIGRFIEYIELGNHPQNAYKGKAKPDAAKVRLTFELLHPKKNIKDIEVDGETRTVGEYISVNVTKKLSDKAKFKKLWNAMTYGRPIKHMSQMLGEAFIINIYHNVVEDGGQKKVYANLDKDGVYGISAPFKVDPLSEERTDIPVRENIKPLRIFLWENPTKESWDSLFIDGTREVKKDGGEVEHVSKNWLQELIMSATNYKGSPLEAMLSGVDELPDTEAEVKPKATTTRLNPKPAAAKPAAAKAQTAAKKAAAPKSSADDALAALGLA